MTSMILMIACERPSATHDDVNAYEKKDNLHR